ncbi:hypothetical protein KQI52_03670 [bacterium]|nr:hypothetical protein [bacterium]
MAKHVAEKVEAFIMTNSLVRLFFLNKIRGGISKNNIVTKSYLYDFDNKNNEAGEVSKDNIVIHSFSISSSIIEVNCDKVGEEKE